MGCMFCPILGGSFLIAIEAADFGSLFLLAVPVAMVFLRSSRLTNERKS